MFALDQLPPQDLDAERVVIGSVLLDAELYDDVRLIIGTENFYLDAHRKIFAVIDWHLDAGRPCDLNILYRSLKARGQLEDVGGAEYLARCFESAGVGANAGYYARLVKEQFLWRRMAHICGEFLRDTKTQIEPAEDRIGRMEAEIFALTQSTARIEPVRLNDAIDEVLADLDRPPDEQSGIRIPTGLTRLDQIIGGLNGGELTILAARPSGGKSALAQQIAIHAAKSGFPALVFSLEMKTSEWAKRALAMGCQVPLNYITRSRPMTDDVRRAIAYGVPASKANIFIEPIAANMSKITAVSRQMVKRHGVKLIALDYLGLISHEGGKNDTEATKIAHTSRKLKLLAVELGVPILCLCQLNRQIESRGPGEPQLSDLRDSGAIEQDADVVLMLWPQPFPPGTTPTNMPPEQEIKVCVKKQRNGPKETAATMYERATLTFRDSLPDYM